jgi:hypothetical protein
MRKLVIACCLVLMANMSAAAQSRGSAWPVPLPSPFPMGSVVYQWDYVCPRAQGCDFSCATLFALNGVAHAHVFLLNVAGTRAYACFAVFPSQSMQYGYTEVPTEFRWTQADMTLQYGPP